MNYANEQEFVNLPLIYPWFIILWQKHVIKYLSVADLALGPVAEVLAMNGMTTHLENGE